MIEQLRTGRRWLCHRAHALSPLPPPHTPPHATTQVGSLIYMAPEVLTGHKYNEKVDVFAFGVILFELMSGCLVVARAAAAGGVVGAAPESGLHAAGHMLEYAQQVRANGGSSWRGRGGLML